jgi:hypothetical protein
VEEGPCTRAPHGGFGAHDARVQGASMVGGWQGWDITLGRGASPWGAGGGAHPLLLLPWAFGVGIPASGIRGHC